MPDPVSLAAELERLLRPVEIGLAIAWWDANTSASDEARRRRERLELTRRTILGDADLYAAVRDALTRADDPLVARQLDVVARAMAPNQVDASIRARLAEAETAVEAVYVDHRGEIDGERASDNRIEEILATSGDEVLRRKAWEASKSVGAVAAADVIDLARLRNEVARAHGHRDHYAMALALDELDEARMFRVLDDVDAATAEPFSRWKATLDDGLAQRFRCRVEELRPWHYDDPFFQEAPVSGRPTLDEHLAGADVEALTTRTFDGLGLDVHGVLARSDLYAREGKSQHAFCLDVDRAGDVRVLANVIPNERWMATLLHEFGHGAYDVGVDPGLPFLLREPAHMLLTEAVAMLFGRLVHDAEWLTSVLGLDGEAGALRDGLAETQRIALLVFARWVLVMTHFERDLYRFPDADHDTRWWDLVERFQLVRRPEGRSAPDWAAKIHLAVAPVYYQNYLFGELLASQMQATLRHGAGGIVDRPEAGAWLRDRVFAVGARDRWDRVVAAATGEELTVRHFAAEVSATTA